MLKLTPQGVLRALIEKAAPGSYCFTIARTRHFDEALLAGLRAGIEQLVIWVRATRAPSASRTSCAA